MSPSSSQAKLAPETEPESAWKQEVNRRLAAHKSRKGGSAAQPETAEAHRRASRRAEQAAARVAARYAQAPSYSEMLAEEARSAVRAAEAASRAALVAQAAAESVLAELEADLAAERSDGADVSEEATIEPAWHAPEVTLENAESFLERVSESMHAPQVNPAVERPVFGILWDEDLPVRSETPTAARASRGSEARELPLAGWWEPESRAQAGDAFEPVEPAQPIHANLIEFPREIVATRKVRPRLVEGRFALAGEQLSIFEVDPGSISIEPEAAAATSEAATPSWEGPVWSGIRLDAQPRNEPAHETATAVRSATVQLAPLGWRLMAAIVDGSLITAVLVGVTMEIAAHVKTLPSMRAMEMLAAVGLLMVGGLYQALFFTLGKATPGMKYAQLSLCTFEDQEPNREQVRSRLCAMGLSVLPLGVGVAWAIFDEEHLSWHDRLSGTYLRRG